MNVDLIQVLTNILPYAQQYEDMYNTMIERQNKLSTAEHDLHESEKRFESLSGTLDSVKFFNRMCLGLILIAFVGIFILGKFESGIEIVSNGIIIAFFSLIEIACRKLKKTLESKRDRKKFELQNQVYYAEQYLKLSEEEIQNYLLKMKENKVFDIIPTDYFFSGAIEHFILSVRKTLADDLNQAIILYEDELKQDSANEKQAYMVQNQLKAMADIKDAVDFNTLITWLSSK